MGDATRKAWASSVLALALACGCDAQVERGAALPLIEGRDIDVPGVVAVSTLDLYGAGVGALCTGALIGPYAVLTSKHCLTNAEVVAPTSVRVFVTGDYFTTKGEPWSVVAVRTTEGTSLDGPDGSGTGDLAVLLLEADASVIATPFEASFDSPAIDQAVVMHGLGGNVAEREAYARVSSIEGGMVTLDQQDGRLCNGDSGGPIVDRANGRVIGVSRSVTTCDPGGQAFAVRVDRHEALVRSGIYYRPGCGTGPEICGNGADEDCNGLVDEGCEMPPRAPVTRAPDAGSSVGSDAGRTSRGTPVTLEPEPMAENPGCTVGRPRPDVPSWLLLLLVATAIRRSWSRAGVRQARRQTPR